MDDTLYVFIKLIIHDDWSGFGPVRANKKRRRANVIYNGHFIDTRLYRGNRQAVRKKVRRYMRKYKVAKIKITLNQATFAMLSTHYAGFDDDDFSNYLSRPIAI